MNRALELLYIIKQDNERVELLLPLQKELIRQLKKIEKQIIYLKKARSRLQSWKKQKRAPSDAPKVKIIKSLIIMCDDRTEEYHHHRFLWRCIGDGIAAIYQSKHSLKHLYFDKNYSPKQEPGFISGKSGFKNEYKMLVMGIKMGVPVVMTDLTNIIRHGDLCALAAEEPVPIEIKSSRNRNARTDRQFEQLRELHAFFTQDEIYGYRGNHLTVRKALNYDEVNCQSELNNCIEATVLKNGFSSVTPEIGLRYFVFTNEWFQEKQLKLDSYFGKPKQNSIIVNIACDERLLPSYPFVLSMNPRNALLFMQNRINIIVEIDLLEVKNKFKKHKLHAIEILDGLHAFQIMIDENDILKGVFRISEMLFLRVATEFLSLDWFVREQAETSNYFKLSSSDIVFDENSLKTLESWEKVTGSFSVNRQK